MSRTYSESWCCIPASSSLVTISSPADVKDDRFTLSFGEPNLPRLQLAWESACPFRPGRMREDAIGGGHPLPTNVFGCSVFMMWRPEIV